MLFRTCVPMFWLLLASCWAYAVLRLLCCFRIMVVTPLHSCVSIVAMFLFVCVLQSARGRLPGFSSCVTSVGFVTP